MDSWFQYCHPNSTWIEQEDFLAILIRIQTMTSGQQIIKMNSSIETSNKIFNNIKLELTSLFEIRIRPENFLSEHKFYEFTFEKTVLENKLCKCSYEENFQCQSENVFIDSYSFQRRKRRSISGLNVKSFETDFFVYDYDPIYKVTWF